MAPTSRSPARAAAPMRNPAEGPPFDPSTAALAAAIVDLPEDLKRQADRLATDGMILEHELRELVSACQLHTALAAAASPAAAIYDAQRIRAATFLLDRWRIGCWRLSAAVESEKVSSDTWQLLGGVLGAMEARILPLYEQLGPLAGDLHRIK